MSFLECRIIIEWSANELPKGLERHVLILFESPIQLPNSVASLTCFELHIDLNPCPTDP
jgi:hypothetical protein